MVKTYDRYNLLPKKEYCISRELQDVLLMQDFYLIVFRVLNTNKQDVVYNYIGYNLSFLRTFFLFLIAKNDSLDINREPGYFLSVIDSDLFPKDWVGFHDPLHLSIISDNIGNVLSSLDAQISYDKAMYGILNIISRLFYVCNYDTMYSIFENSIYRRYLPFIEQILGHLSLYPSLMSKSFSSQEAFSASLINGCVFMVRDKDKFINRIRESKLFSNINAGPQKYRGEPNSASNFLSLLDRD
jgi:hypothetical protein